MKVLHVLYTYFPDVTGSSVRSEGIASGQKNHGDDVIIITSPFQKGVSSEKVDLINDIEVYRSYDSKKQLNVSEEKVSLISRILKVFYILPFFFHIYKLAKNKKVEVIHAHSMFFCAYSAYLAAKLLKLPFVYEFRSVWEERFQNRVQNKLIRIFETFAMKVADSVVVINNGLRQEVISRGISESKVFIVPNAVSEEVLNLAKTVEPPTKISRFGYVGNFSKIEGLNYLIEAFRQAFPIAQHPSYSLTFFGRGPFSGELDRLIEQLDDSRVHNKGEFARENLPEVYSSIDCIVMPRINLKICQTVTPLKPLEAMSFSRLFLGSTVGGISEVGGGVNSGNYISFAPDSAADLKDKLIQATQIDVSEIILSGHRYATEKCNWNRIASYYASVYQYAVQSKC